MSLSELGLFTPSAAESLLTSIRNRSKQSAEIHKLLSENALEDLFVYIAIPPEPHLINLSLSVIANLLVKEEGKELIKPEQLKYLIRLLDEVSSDEQLDDSVHIKTSLQSRIIRAIGNACNSHYNNRITLANTTLYRVRTIFSV